jgi:NADH-quinone oxidoreductase chain G
MDTQTQQETVTLTIDDKSVTVPKGTMVADAAKSVDIDIPVFCYHEKLGPFGCCRMCLVEVEKMPKLTTACTLAVGEGMVVKTNTSKVEKAQKGVLEFTLLNHPLDCPVCDKGGECPLQDNTFKFGPDTTRMEFVRQDRDKATPLSPVITIDRERCIACQRCTRYSDIIEKDQALVMRHRGFQNRVSTFNDQPYDTRFSGNVIDICPVGALTNTEFRFSARSWDLKNTDTLCGHCGCNCNMTLGTRLNEMKRITTRTNDLVDDGWICDKARWGYDFTKSKNRITQARKKGQTEPLALDDACKQVADSLKQVVEQHGPNSVGFIGSPYGLNEELFLYQKLFRQNIGTNNFDHKTYADTPGLPLPHHDLLNVEQSDLIVLLASDPTEELPILDLRIKKAVTRQNSKLIVINDQATLMDKYASQALRHNIGSGPLVYEALANVIGGTFSFPADFQKNTGLETSHIEVFAEKIKNGGKVTIIYNPAAMTGNSIHFVKHMLATLNDLPVEAGAFPAAPATNALGAMDMGVLPDFYPGGLPLSQSESIKELWGESAPLEPGLNARQMIEKAASGELKALVVFRSNPVIDFPGGAEVEKALGKLDLLVVQDALETETSRLAHYVLPSAGPGFDEGTTTNVGGRVQWRKAGLTQENPADWKIIASLIREWDEEISYKNSFAVTKEITDKIKSYWDINRSSVRNHGKKRGALFFEEAARPASESLPERPNGALQLRVANYLFEHDKMLDAESALAHQFKPSTVYIHSDDAMEYGLKSGDEIGLTGNGHEVRAQVEVYDRCNSGGVVLLKVSDEQGVMNLVVPGESAHWVKIKK